MINKGHFTSFKHQHICHYSFIICEDYFIMSYVFCGLCPMWNKVDDVTLMSSNVLGLGDKDPKREPVLETGDVEFEWWGCLPGREETLFHCTMGENVILCFPSLTRTRNCKSAQSQDFATSVRVLFLTGGSSVTSAAGEDWLEPLVHWTMADYVHTGILLKSCQCET